jgi:hypothetical protein
VLGDKQRPIEDPVLLCPCDRLALIEQHGRPKAIRHLDRLHRSFLIDLLERQTIGQRFIQGHELESRLFVREQRHHRQARVRQRLTEPERKRQNLAAPHTTQSPKPQLRLMASTPPRS